MASVSTLGGELPEPPTDIELESVGCFISLFGREFVRLLTDQSNLYFVQKDPNKPVRVSEMEMRRFSDILIMTGCLFTSRTAILLDEPDSCRYPFHQ